MASRNVNLIVASIFLLVAANAKGSRMIKHPISEALVYFNGLLDNRQQDRAEFDFVQTKILQVKCESFGDNVVVYAEEDCNDDIAILHLGFLSFVPPNKIVMKLFNFANASDYKPRTYPVEEVCNIPIESLTTDEDCYADLYLYDGVVNGTFPDCKFWTADGKHPRFRMILDCKIGQAYFPVNINQKWSEKLYVFYPTAKRFPIDVPEDFISPCPEYEVSDS